MDNNDSSNEHAHEMALEFLIAVITADNERADQLTHKTIDCGMQFIHDFYGALYFHINALVNATLDHAHPDAVKLIEELCDGLKAGKGTNFWDTYAIRIEHPDFKISEKLKASGRKDDPTSYWKGEWR